MDKGAGARLKPGTSTVSRRTRDVREASCSERCQATAEPGSAGRKSVPARGARVTIELAGLVVFGHHGFLEEERRLGQRFLVDLWVEVDETASTSDRLEDTVDYRRLARLVREVFAGAEHLLLESLAGAVADGLLSRFPAVQRVRVRVRKPDVVLDPTVEYAAVVVERGRLRGGQTRV